MFRCLGRRACRAIAGRAEDHACDGLSQRIDDVHDENAFLSRSTAEACHDEEGGAYSADEGAHVYFLLEVTVYHLSQLFDFWPFTYRALVVSQSRSGGPVWVSYLDHPHPILCLSKSTEQEKRRGYKGK